MSDSESSPPPSPVSSVNDASDTEPQVSNETLQEPSSTDAPSSTAPAPKKRKRVPSKTKSSNTKKSTSTKAKSKSSTENDKPSKKTKKSTKTPPSEAPKDPEAFKAPRGRPKTSDKSTTKSKTDDAPKQPRLKKADIEIPTRFDNTEEGWKKFCLYAQEGLGKMTYKKYLIYNKRCRAAELKRLKHANKKRVDEAATLSKYKTFLKEADAKHFAELDGVWLMNHGFNGLLSYKAIRSNASPPEGDRDYRYDATLLLFNECLRRKVKPLGIVSGNTNDTVYTTKVDEDGNSVLSSKNGKPIRVIESFQYAFSVPEGDRRVWVGTASRFRGGFEKHPLSCAKIEREKLSDDVRLGVGEPMVSFQ